MTETILPLCYCVAHDGAHVHLPPMVDSQYGLRIHVLAPSDPSAVQPEPSPAGGDAEAKR